MNNKANWGDGGEPPRPATNEGEASNEAPQAGRATRYHLEFYLPGGSVHVEDVIEGFSLQIYTPSNPPPKFK